MRYSFVLQQMFSFSLLDSVYNWGNVDWGVLALWLGSQLGHLCCETYRTGEAP
jgi:hypothetical protein